MVSRNFLHCTKSEIVQSLTLWYWEKCTPAKRKRVPYSFCWLQLRIRQNMLWNFGCYSSPRRDFVWNSRIRSCGLKAIWYSSDSQAGLIHLSGMLSSSSSSGNFFFAWTKNQQVGQERAPQSWDVWGLPRLDGKRVCGCSAKRYVTLLTFLETNVPSFMNVRRYDRTLILF